MKALYARDTEPATIYEDGDFTVAIPMFDACGVAGFVEYPVIGWRIDGSTRHGKLIPVIEVDVDTNGDDIGEPADSIFAVRYPDGHWYFEDSERCDNPADVLAGLEKRLKASDVGKPALDLPAN